MKQNPLSKAISFKGTRNPYLWLVVFIVLFLIGGCQSDLIDNSKPTQAPPKYKTVSESEYGSQNWPFTVSEGQIECWGDSQMLFRTSEGTYELNGYTSDKYNFTNIKNASIIKSDHIQSGIFSFEFVDFVNNGISYCLEP
jgi:hypothetical protein